jgi:hypothetical protein
MMRNFAFSVALAITSGTPALGAYPAYVSTGKFGSWETAELPQPEGMKCVLHTSFSGASVSDLSGIVIAS